MEAASVFLLHRTARLTCTRDAWQFHATAAVAVVLPLKCSFPTKLLSVAVLECPRVSPSPARTPLPHCGG